MSGLHIRQQLLPDVFLLDCPHSHDSRGSFLKIFNCHEFNKLGLNFIPAESFISKSSLGVLRGMHFQIDEAAHEKLVFCPCGHVLDVVVDVRPDSPLFNKPVFVYLRADDPVALFVGKGYAHGFLSLENESLMIYYTSTVYAPALDKGVLWSSIDFDWPIASPILSNRDLSHPSICDFK